MTEPVHDDAEGVVGSGTLPILAELAESPKRYSFYQLLTLLAGAGLSIGPGQRTGGDDADQGETIPRLLLRGTTSLAFPGGDVSALSHDAVAGVWRLDACFLGIYGPDSPLPAFFTEELVTAQREPDPVRDFLDLFNHRLLELTWSIWVKYRFYRSLDSAAGQTTLRRLLILCGLGGSNFARPEHGAPLLPLGGLLMARTRSAGTLRAVLASRLSVSVRIEEGAAHGFAIHPAQLCRLRQNTRLGRDFVIGRHKRDALGAVRIHLHPHSDAQFRRLLPDGVDHAAMRSLVATTLRTPLAHAYLLHAPQMHPPSLGSAQLGWTFCLSQQPTNWQVMFAARG